MLSLYIGYHSFAALFLLSAAITAEDKPESFFKKGEKRLIYLAIIIFAPIILPLELGNRFGEG